MQRTGEHDQYSRKHHKTNQKKLAHWERVATGRTSGVKSSDKSLYRSSFIVTTTMSCKPGVNNLSLEPLHLGHSAPSSIVEMNRDCVAIPTHIFSDIFYLYLPENNYTKDKHLSRGSNHQKMAGSLFHYYCLLFMAVITAIHGKQHYRPRSEFVKVNLIDIVFNSCPSPISCISSDGLWKYAFEK